MALRFLSPIHKATRQISIYLEESCTDLDLSTTEGHMLSYLRSYSPAPVSELHRVFGIKRSTLTSMLDRLETRGWIERAQSRRDRRSILVVLTGGGRERAERVQATIEELEARVNAALGPGDWNGFNAVMSTIAAVTDVSVAERGDPTAIREEDTK
jgi:DNA-binding MarR family transcriptional regulator